MFHTAKYKGGRITWARKINPVVFDAVCSAANIYGNESLPDASLAERYTSLVFDEEFATAGDISNIVGSEVVGGIENYNPEKLTQENLVTYASK